MESACEEKAACAPNAEEWRGLFCYVGAQHTREPTLRSKKKPGARRIVLNHRCSDYHRRYAIVGRGIRRLRDSKTDNHVQVYTSSYFPQDTCTYTATGSSQARNGDCILRCVAQTAIRSSCCLDCARISTVRLCQHSLIDTPTARHLVDLDRPATVSVCCRPVGKYTTKLHFFLSRIVLLLLRIAIP